MNGNIKKKLIKYTEYGDKIEEEGEKKLIDKN